MNSITIFLTAGRGPDECKLAVQGFANLMQAEAEASGLRVQAPEPRRKGVESCILVVEGDTAQDVERFLAAWGLNTTGRVTLLWDCPSPLRPNHGRRKWFIGASLSPDMSMKQHPWPPEPNDLEWSTMRSGGPGGQHVNTTDSAVRLVHLPTGITIRSSDQRSQHMNKRDALDKLSKVLQDIGKSMSSALARERWNEHDSFERGNPVRTQRGVFPKF